MGGKIEKPYGGTPPGLRSGAPRARRCAPVWFLNFTTHRENKVKILSKKVRDTQPNPRYSAKNNVAIRMIATFIPTTSFDLFTSALCYLLQEQITNKIKYKLTIMNMDPAVSIFYAFHQKHTSIYCYS